MVQLGFDATKVNPMDQPVERVWSPLQKNIFRFVAHGQGNAIIEAVAGSGKSTTIVEAMGHCMGTTLFLAFNKSIADELKMRGVNARTFHSMTYGPTLRHVGVGSVTDSKLFNLVKENWSRDDIISYSSFAFKMVSLAKQQGIGCLIDDKMENWIAIADHHDLSIDEDSGDIERAFELTRELFDLSIIQKSLDFDDLLYYPVKYNIPLKKFDFIFCDEAQDTNAIQRAILRKIMGPTSRLIAVGDRSQAIYGFRGADSDSLDLIARDFNCTRLPLSVTYRCPEAVVRYARQWEPAITARPGAPEGAVTELGADWNIKLFQPDDIVVCRTTAPLIQVAFHMLKNRIPVTVLGRDIGDGLKRIVIKMNAVNIDHFEEKLCRYRDREVARHVKRGEEKLAESVQDKVEALLVLCDSLSEDERTVDRLLDVISSVFTNKSEATKLATIHRAKGLEAKRVFWLNRSQCPSKWATKEHQKQQERNLCYVATTRAAEELVLIETG